MTDGIASQSFRFDDIPVAPAHATTETAPSIELTASDGTGLALVSLSARVVVEDPLAFTELHLTFQNPADRQLEGRFRISLPPRASVSRFAMRIGGGWQEGEVVERKAAQRVYEDFLHRRQDPALLEHEAGNEFSARVFPIEARERKEIILSYSHELVQAGEPYRLPLLGLPRLGSLEIRAIIGRTEGGAAISSLGGTTASNQVVEVSKTDWKPDVDFEVRPPPSGRAGIRRENLVLLRVAPPLPTEPDEVRSLLVLVDTSASRALGVEAQVHVVEGLVAGLAQGAGQSTPLCVACFDQGVARVFEGTAGEYSGEKLVERLPLGASDLVGALRWAATREGPRYERVLVVTDGITTAGPVEPEALVSAVQALGSAGVRRIDAVAVGGIRDDAALRRLTTGGLARAGTVSTGDLSPRDIASRLTRATRSGISVQVPGASWLWPTQLDGMQPGEAALVYADVPPERAVEVVIDGKPAPLGGGLGLVERPLLERAWVKARLEKLEDMRAQPGLDPDLRSGLLHQIVDLSVKYRVLCAHTALLVLETEADYTRYHIDRRALADILTVGPSGVTTLARRDIVLPQTFSRPPFDTLKDAPLAKNAVLGAAEPTMDSLEAMPSHAERHAPAAPAFGELAEVEDEVEGIDVGAMPEASYAPAPAAYAPSPAPMAAPPMAAPRPSAPMPSPSVASRSASPARAAATGSPLRRLARAVGDFFSPDESRVAPQDAPSAPEPSPLDAWTGPFREVMALLLAGKAQAALEAALRWRKQSPGDVLALVALGEAAEALRDQDLAARAYGSLIDLFPSRADLRRFAGERLSRLSDARALALAIDTYARAVESRPDHPSSHRLLGMALLRAGRYAEAFEAIAKGQARSYPPKFPGVDRILTEDLALCAAALIRSEPARRDEILTRLAAASAKPEDAPSVRFVLVWETDANDVDFHIHDAKGGHAYYSQRELASGGELYADVTQGYGPECFTIRLDPRRRPYPYRLQAHYYRMGPMGYGMGALQIIEHDGKGRLTFEERPYVVMIDRAFVDLGEVTAPLRLD